MGSNASLTGEMMERLMMITLYRRPMARRADSEIFVIELQYAALDVGGRHPRRRSDARQDIATSPRGAQRACGLFCARDQQKRPPFR